MMTNRQADIHKRARDLSRKHRQTEFEIVEILQEVNDLKVHLALGISSVFQYTVEYLELDEALAYGFINVARKARIFSSLQDALRTDSLSVSKAARIVASLTPENQTSLVEFAINHSKREIEIEIARINPKATGKNCVKQLSEDFVQVTITMPRSTHEKMKRAEDIHGLSPAETLERVYEEHLNRHDPVRKAHRNAKEELCPGRVGRLNAAEIHAVQVRDEGRCTWIDMRGRRCGSSRWTEIHHIVPKARGGTNDLSNLTTLCRPHHQALHDALTAACLNQATGVIKMDANRGSKIWGNVPGNTGTDP